MLTRLGLLLARAELAAPPGEAPFGVLLRPFGGDLLPLNHTGHWAFEIDGRTLFTTNVGCRRKTDHKNERDHVQEGLRVPKLRARLSGYPPLQRVHRETPLFGASCATYEQRSCQQQQ
jgi:hypothetical protein